MSLISTGLVTIFAIVSVPGLSQYSSHLGKASIQSDEYLADEADHADCIIRQWRELHAKLEV